MLRILDFAWTGAWKYGLSEGVINGQVLVFVSAGVSCAEGEF